MMQHFLEAKRPSCHPTKSVEVLGEMLSWKVKCNKNIATLDHQKCSVVLKCVKFRVIFPNRGSAVPKTLPMHTPAGCNYKPASTPVLHCRYCNMYTFTTHDGYPGDWLQQSVSYFAPSLLQWARRVGLLVSRPSRLLPCSFTVHTNTRNMCCSLAERCIHLKVHTLDIAPLRSESPPQKRSGMACVLKGFHSFTCTPTRSSTIGMSHTCLPLPSQPQLVLIYRPQRDGRLSRPWCEVAQAEIRTCNLPIANPALYHTATSAPS